MKTPGEIRIGGSPRSLEEEEGLQLAVTILELKQRVRYNAAFRPMPGPTRRP